MELEEGDEGRDTPKETLSRQDTYFFSSQISYLGYYSSGFMVVQYAIIVLSRTYPSFEVPCRPSPREERNV